MIPQLVVVLSVLIILWYAKNAFTNADPAKLARYVKQLGGYAALAVGAFMLMRGQMEAAVAVGGFGLYLLGFANPPAFARMFGKFGGAGGAVSRMRSAMIEMELRHDNGAMDGSVLAGSFMGRRLDELTRPQCDELLGQCRNDDPDGARLLEAYFDRRFPGWRPAGEAYADARGGARGGGQRVPAGMTEDEAYEILGLAKGASGEEIARAHRTLMKKLHPDYGGPTALAAKVNEAKAVLMSRHG